MMGYRGYNNYRKYNRRGVRFDAITVTVREVIASIAIVCALLIVGITIGNNISDNHDRKVSQYVTALQTDEDSTFGYYLDTKVGNILAYGEIKTLDPVTVDGIGDYSLIKREEEHYKMHTRTVTTVDSEGHSHTRTETYWSWDHYHTDWWSSKRIQFLNREFDADAIPYRSLSYIKTYEFAHHKRYVYYAAPSKITGTVFANTITGTITDVEFYANTIESTLSYINKNTGLVLFWVFWSIFIVAFVAVFYAIDNDWLED